VQVLEGHYFSMDLSDRFHDKGKDLQFTATGLPDGSGLTFDSGIVSGTPNTVDLQHEQPLVLRVTAVNGMNGHVTGIVPLMVRKLSDPLVEYEGLYTKKSNVVSIPIPQQVVVQGEIFVSGTKSFFHDPDGEIAYFTLTGLPTGSGMSMDRKTGIISGTPNHVDAYTSQPLELVVNAIGEEGQVISEDMYLTVFHGKEQTNNAPVSNAIAPAYGKVGIPFTYGVGSGFSDADKDELTYEINGLPIFTGLELDSKTGMISGVPTDFDAAIKPMRVTITATDPLRESTQQVLSMVIESNSDEEPSAPSSSSLPQATVKMGGTVRIPLSDYFTDDSELSFVVFGLPEESGFRIENGMFVGTPSTSDLSLPRPALLGIVAENLQGLRAAEPLLLTIDSTSAAVGTFKNTLNVHVVDEEHITVIPEVDFVHGEWSAHSFAGYFPSYKALPNAPSVDVNFSVQGLPEGSSLVMDPVTGVFYGLPTAADVVAMLKLSTSKVYPIRVQAEYFVDGESFDSLEQIIFVRILSEDAGLANSAPMARSLPNVEVHSSEMLLLDTMGSFSDPEDDPLTFSVLGLPEDTGFSIVPSSGVLFGTPSVSDVSSAQPLTLTIIVEDANGGTAQETMFVTVRKESEADFEEADGSESVSSYSSSPCNKLKWKVSPFSKDKKKCSSAKFNLGGKKGKGKGKGAKCAQPVEYSAAVATCAKFGARVCSVEDLQNDVGRAVGCKSDRKRVWTSSTCLNGHMSSGASTLSVKSKAPKCTETSKKLPFLCCADFAQGKEFSNFEASVTKNSAIIEFNWPAYKFTDVSYKLVNQKKWKKATEARVLLENGHASVEIKDLSPGAKYVVRVMPVAGKRVIRAQAMLFTVETPRF